MTLRPIFALSAALVGLALHAAAAAEPAPAAGATLYRQRCQSCHAIEPGKTSTLAPNLRGVVGRKAAKTQFRYSPALQAAGLTWSRENLDRFLTDPARVVPGTRMVVRISDPSQRAQLIAYLASQH